MDIAVIADDFTGANANGALLTAKGFSSATCLGPDPGTPQIFLPTLRFPLMRKVACCHSKKPGRLCTTP